VDSTRATVLMWLQMALHSTSIAHCSAFCRNDIMSRPIMKNRSYAALACLHVKRLSSPSAQLQQTKKHSVRYDVSHGTMYCRNGCWARGTAVPEVTEVRVQLVVQLPHRAAIGVRR
jgi:hypothetical protein